jgi:hypothetical protein
MTSNKCAVFLLATVGLVAQKNPKTSIEVMRDKKLAHATTYIVRNQTGDDLMYVACQPSPWVYYSTPTTLPYHIEGRTNELWTYSNDGKNTSYALEYADKDDEKRREVLNGPNGRLFKMAGTSATSLCNNGKADDLKVRAKLRDITGVQTLNFKK